QLEVRLVVEQEEIAVAAEVDLVHRLELGERAERDPDVQLVGELRPDPARRGARRPGRQRVALEHDDALDAEPAQVPRDAGAHRSAAHDDDLSSLHGAILAVTPEGRCGTGPPAPSGRRSSTELLREIRPRRREKLARPYAGVE